PPHVQAEGAFGPTSPSRRERLSSAEIPVRNSFENPAISESGRPSACSPCQVKATCTAVSGALSTATALLTGAAASHSRAAAALRIFSSRKQESVSAP